MSTQDDSKAIPLAFAHEQSPLRLLELPPSLLSLIENSTPSDVPIIKIKAAPAASSSSTSDGSNINGPQPFAVLTTATETFTIRNVHSSNSIFLLKPKVIPVLQDAPTKTSMEDEDVDMLSDPLEVQSKLGVVVSSTCASHLELLPQKPVTEVLLRSFVTEYVSPEKPLIRPSNPPSKNQIMLDTPVSDAEFAAGWTDVDGFELDGWAMRLAPTSALQIFRSISTIMYATSGGGNLEWRSEGLEKDRIMEIVNDDGELEDWPATAIHAVIERSWEMKDLGGKTVCYFNLSHATKWVGKLILTSNPTKSFSEKDFLETWKNAVPADCTDLIDLKLLDGSYTQSVLGVIRYIHGDTAATTEGANTGSVSNKKKKWHEKFAAGKKR